MTLTVVSSGIDRITQLSPCTISVPKNGRLQDLTRALSIACSLGVEETLLVAEVYLFTLNSNLMPVPFSFEFRYGCLAML